MATWLEAANGWSHLWASAMARACWQGGLALALVWAWCRVVPRTPARVRCWLWRLAYLKLLVALAGASPIPLPLLRPATASPVARTPARSPQGERPTPVSATVSETAARVAVPLLASPPRSRFATPPPSPFLLLSALWLAGVSVCAARLGLAWRATVRLRRRCEPVDDPALLRALADLAGRYGLRRCPPLLSAGGIASPLLVGVFRPAVVLPQTLCATCPAHELRLVLAHELAHLKRRDLAWNALAAVAEGLFYFHPPVWLARREWRLAQEIACDEAAITATVARPADYAGALLRVVEHWTPARRVVAAGMFRSGRALERRLVAMKYFDIRPRRLWLAGATVLCVGVVGFPTWKVVAQEAPAAPATKPAVEGAKAAPETQATAIRLSGLTKPERDRVIGERDKHVRSYDFTGHIVARSVDIRSPVAGVVEKMNFEEGQFVKAGNWLFKLDNQLKQYQLQAAMADFEKKKIDLQRIEEVYRDLINHKQTNTEIDVARIDVQIARISIDYRKGELGQDILLAPFDGAVTDLRANAGQAVSAGILLARVVETGQLKLEFPLAPEDRSRIRLGTKVEVLDPSSVAIQKDTLTPLRTFSGQVSYLAAEVEMAEQRIRVKASLDGVGSWLSPNQEVKFKILWDN